MTWMSAEQGDHIEGRERWFTSRVHCRCVSLSQTGDAPVPLMPVKRVERLPDCARRQISHAEPWSSPRRPAHECHCEIVRFRSTVKHGPTLHNKCIEVHLPRRSYMLQTFIMENESRSKCPCGKRTFDNFTHELFST